MVGFSKQPSHLGVEWDEQKSGICTRVSLHLLLSSSFFKIYESHLFVLQFESLSGDRNGNPLQYSFLENPMDRGARQAEVHGVTESDTHGICG